MEPKLPNQRALTDRVLSAERHRIDVTLEERRASEAADDVLGLPWKRSEPHTEPESDRASPPSPISKLAELRSLSLSRAAAAARAAERLCKRAAAVGVAEHGAQAITATLAAARTTTDHLLALERASADRAIAARDEFLGATSHDLRGMLAIVELNAGLIESSDLALMARVGNIHAMHARMRRLIDDLTDFARMEVGKLSVIPTTHDALGLLQKVHGLFSPLAAARGVQLDRVASTELLITSFDDDRISQVLSNLLSNAIKFTPDHGHISLAARCTRGELVFSVSDDGCGIDRDNLERVFERFWQVSDKEGSGLGLYICRGIVEAHGGRIWAESSPGKGTTFRFTLPLQERDGAARA